MEAIFQTTSSNAFSLMKMYKFYIEISPKFVWMVQIQYFSIGSDNGLAPNRRQAIIWINDG